MAWRIARYPGRVGHSVLRSPLIFRDTLTGKRTFVGKRGFFETTTPEQRSIPQGRGQRTPR